MKKKKFLYFFLVLMLCFSSTISAYASSGSHGGGGTSFGESEKESSSGVHGGGGSSTDETSSDFSYVESLGKTLGDLLARAATATVDFCDGALSGFDSFISENLTDWLEKGYIKGNPDNFEFLPECTKVVNDYLRSKIQEYNGYYLIEPQFQYPADRITSYYGYSYDQKNLLDSYFKKETHNIMMYNGYYYGSYFVFPKDFAFYIDSTSSGSSSSYGSVKPQDVSTSNTLSNYVDWVDNSSRGPSISYAPDGHGYSIMSVLKSDPTNGLDKIARYTCGTPFKVFKSYYYLTKYVDVGLSYTAELPDSFTIPKKYVTDSLSLPDITYNVDKSNKTENTIQNEYNTIINNYITNLGGSSSGGSGSGGESGGGSGSGGSSGGGNITDTELYDFLTKLWNESDKKFDKMIDLLEANNKYQKKLVDSLNDIKAILVTEAVFNAFKDRSSQTADKAKDKFPTSIPWDVAMVLNAMSAEPEQLKFSLPIQVKSIGINETIDIDLSSEEWEKLAKTCRYLLSITFILFLIHLTRKMFGGGDD